MKALQESGLSYDPDMVVWFHTEDRKMKPAQMTELLLQQQVEMDAVVCYNDQIALEVIRSLQKTEKECRKIFL